MFRQAVRLAVAVSLVATVAWAGDGKKCTYDTQVCLNHLAQQGQVGWLGVEGEMVETGYLVTHVFDGAPADEAGVRVGDVLTALNGVGKSNVNFEQVYFEVMVPGNRVTFTFTRGNSKSQFEAMLVRMPRDTLARRVGHHMLEHAELQATRSEKEE